MSVLPTGSSVTITSVQLFWSDGTVTTSRRRELLAATVVGVQVAYSVVTAASAGSTSSIEALLSNPTTVSAVSTNLAATIPGVTVQVPLMLDPSSAPTTSPTFAPSSLQPTKQTIIATAAPSVGTMATSFPTTTVGVLNTVIAVTQTVASATLTVSQAQSNTFMTAFAVGIQSAVPGVTITVTSVTAARRRLLASVVVSYSASSTTVSTSALSASLSSSATIASASASLVAAGYAGVSISSPVFASTIGNTVSASVSGTNNGSGTNAGVIAGATVGVLVPVLIGLALLIVYLVKPQLLGCNKTQATTKPHTQPMVTSDPHTNTTKTDTGGANTSHGIATIASTPPGFTAYREQRFGHTYYVDGTSGATVWTRPGELLPGWTAELDNTTGKLFYLHKESCTTSWERPSNDHEILPSSSSATHLGQIEIDVSSDDDHNISRSNSLVQIESIYSGHNEEPPFTDNEIYKTSTYQDHTSSQKSVSSTAVVGSNLPFVLPRPRRPSMEYPGSEMGQQQTQQQSQQTLFSKLFEKPRHFPPERDTSRREAMKNAFLIDDALQVCPDTSF